MPDGTAASGAYPRRAVSPPETPNRFAAMGTLHGEHVWKEGPTLADVQRQMCLVPYEQRQAVFEWAGDAWKLAGVHPLSTDWERDAAVKEPAE